MRRFEALRRDHERELGGLRRGAYGADRCTAGVDCDAIRAGRGMAGVLVTASGDGETQRDNECERKECGDPTSATDENERCQEGERNR